jgi:hypothetical protein
MRFFYREEKEGGEIGPLTQAELLAAVTDGRITPLTAVRNDINGEWVRASRSTTRKMTAAGKPHPSQLSLRPLRSRQATASSHNKAATFRQQFPRRNSALFALSQFCKLLSNVDFAASS